MGYTSVTNTFSSAATIFASAHNQNFTDIINGLSDGTKDLNVAAITCTGFTNTGNTTLGNAVTDTITVTGRFVSSLIPLTTNLYDLGSSSLLYKDLYLAGSATIGSLSGVVKATTGLLSAATLVNADVSATAAITLSKLAATTASRAVVSDASGFLTAATTTSTEIGYVNGVTSAIQTQINNIFDPTSYSDTRATAIGAKEYNHGTTYNGGIAPTVTSSVAGLTIAKASFYPREDQAGQWYVRFEIQGDYSLNSHATATLSVNGLTFANEGNNGWPCSFLQGNDNTTYNVFTYAGRNTSSIIYRMNTSISGLSFAIAGWAKLSGKPSWAY